MPFLPTLLHHCSTHEHQLLFLHIPLPSTTAPIFNTTASQLVTTPSAGQGGTLPSSHTASEGHVYSNMNTTLYSILPHPFLALCSSRQLPSIHLHCAISEILKLPCYIPMHCTLCSKCSCHNTSHILLH